MCGHRSLTPARKCPTRPHSACSLIMVGQGSVAQANLEFGTLLPQPPKKPGLPGNAMSSTFSGALVGSKGPSHGAPACNKAWEGEREWGSIFRS